MQLVKHEITLDSDSLDLYAIGDLHIASKAFNKPAFLKIVDEIKQKDAHWVGMGDFGECYSQDTDILTLDGWKSGLDLLPGEVILTWNPTKNALEYQPTRTVVSYLYQGPMVRIKKKGVLDCLVTPNHRMVFRNAPNEPHREYRATQLFNTRKSSIGIPVTAPSYEGHDNPVFSTDLCCFIGWLVCEGWKEERGNSVRYSLGQSIKANPEHVKEIDVLLNRLGWKFSRGINKNNIVIWKICAEDSKEVDTFMNGKCHRIPRIVLNLPRQKLTAIYDTIMKADGNHEKKTVKWKSHTEKEGLKDDFVELCHKIGKKCHLSEKYETTHISQKTYSGFYWYVFVSDQGCERWILPEETSAESYTGWVWCPVVDNTFIVVRRNNNIFIAGNSISIADKRRFDPDTIRPLYRDNLARYHQLEVIELKEMLEPIKNKCLGILEGNHETALRTSQFDMIWELCNYFEWHNLTTQAFIRLNLHYPKRQKTLDCDLFVAHGYGGARTKGGAVAKLQRLLDQFLADIVLMAHQHIAQPVIDAKLRLPKGVKELYLDKKIRLGFFVPSFYETYKEGIDTYASRGCWGPSIIGAWKGVVKWIRVQGCDKLLIESPVTNLEG